MVLVLRSGSALESGYRAFYHERSLDFHSPDRNLRSGGIVETMVVSSERGDMM